MPDLLAIRRLRTGLLKELRVEPRRLFPIARQFGRTRGAVEAPEAVGIRLQGLLEGAHGQGGLLQVEQQLAEHLPHRNDPAGHHDVLFGPVLPVGCRAHQLERVVVASFGPGDPCGDRVDLDVRLLDPVVLLLGGHRSAQPGEPRDLRLRRPGISIPRRAEAARIGIHRLALRKGLPVEVGGRRMQRKLRRLGPVSAFEREARRDRRSRIRDLPRLLVRLRRVVDEVDPFAHLRVATELQGGVNHVVERVVGVAVLLRRRA